MHLIQILLPLYDNAQRPFPQQIFDEVKKQLTEYFGGITTFVQSPAEGLWKENTAKTVRDDIVIYEIMVENIDREWWQSYRKQLCRIFQQEELIVRASRIELL
jgi:hypothetical protein